MSRIFDYINIEVKRKTCYQNHTNSVDEVKFLSTEDNKFISGSHDQTICLWDVNKAKPISTFLAQEEGIWTFDIHPDGKTVISSGPCGKIYHSDLTTGKCEKITKTNNEKCYSLRFLSGGSEFIACGQNGFVEKHQLGQGHPVCSFETPDQIVYSCKPINQTGQIMASTSKGEFILFDESLNPLSTFKVTDDEIRVFEIVNNELFTSFSNGDLKIFNFNKISRSLNLISEEKGHTDHISAIIYNEEYDLLISGAKDSSIFAWDRKSKKILHNLVGPKDLISSIDVNRTSKVIVAASWDQTLCSFIMSEVLINSSG